MRDQRPTRKVEAPARDTDLIHQDIGSAHDEASACPIDVQDPMENTSLCKKLCLRSDQVDRPVAGDECKDKSVL